MCGPQPHATHVPRQATRPVEQALKALVQGDKWYHRPGVDGQMVLVVELYRGVARATSLSDHRPTLHFILPALPALVHVLDRMHTHPEVVNHVLQFFSDFVEAQVCCAELAPPPEPGFAHGKRALPRHPDLLRLQGGSPAHL